MESGATMSDSGENQSDVENRSDRSDSLQYRCIVPPKIDPSGLDFLDMTGEYLLCLMHSQNIPEDASYGWSLRGGRMKSSLAIPPLTKDLAQVLIDADSIQRRVDELARQINQDYADCTGTLILVGVLKGSFIFTADLCRKLTVPHVVDFIALSSYGKTGDQQSANVRLLMDTRENMEDRHVLIIEDILDSGNTLDYLIRNFKTRRPASVKTAVLLDKPDRRVVPVHIDYVGFEIPDVWVVGYGLDYAERYRTLPYIAEMYPVK
jgi:hypoxanthine phosphoribosyltransferase